ncbi:hypothetical protein [Defluviicoccus vanus]|uniref:Uncharacterized protein n=1 Tax=Defluviicoccus vanus TaxID=111831 RepID=A0A7H1N0X4_9PROT|nr:hypothetical protein [Defluviicoccus vanus]QNT69360.1 hypothetical protein HQ394_08565 [Defluviicoccus vanus]
MQTPETRPAAQKTFLLLTARGPVVIATAHAAATDIELLGKLAIKGIDKFIAFAIPGELAQDRYGDRLNSAAASQQPENDPHIVDDDGERIYALLPFHQLGSAVVHDSRGSVAVADSVEALANPQPTPVDFRPWPPVGAKLTGGRRFEIMIADLLGDDSDRSRVFRLSEVLKGVPGVKAQRANQPLFIATNGNRTEAQAAAIVPAATCCAIPMPT